MKGDCRLQKISVPNPTSPFSKKLKKVWFPQVIGAQNRKFLLWAKSKNAHVLRPAGDKRVFTKRAKRFYLVWEKKQKRNIKT